MTSYRFKRRSFLASLGGALGLSTLLSNLEANAEGQAPPPRFLPIFWPCGTIPYAFRATGAGRSYVTSPILQPFEDAGLRDDTIVLYGLADRLSGGGGGGHEAGIVMRTTGVNVPGTRLNGGENDDAVAGGPSFDQIFLKNVPALSRMGQTSINAIGDARVESEETSSFCLSYAYQTQSIPSASPGGNIIQHVPRLPIVRPAQLFAQLFSELMPGGSSLGNQSQALRALKLRKSVLDYALGDLGRLRALSPASQRDKLDVHADAIRKIEQQLSDQIANGMPGSCVIPAAPDAALSAKLGSHNYLAEPIAEADESASLAELGRLHLGVLRAAFQCDLARVATFQWTSACDAVAFKGLYPGALDKAYRHHPVSHQISAPWEEAPPHDEAGQNKVQFMINVQTWFNQHTANFVSSLKTTQDIFGGSLLDNTILPFITDVATPNHTRQPLPALIFGGRALGMQGGQYQNFEAAPRAFNDVWLSIAQAFFPDVDDVLVPLGAETFAQNHDSFGGPISGLWQRPV